MVEGGRRGGQEEGEDESDVLLLAWPGIVVFISDGVLFGLFSVFGISVGRSGLSWTGVGFAYFSHGMGEVLGMLGLACQRGWRTRLTSKGGI